MNCPYDDAKLEIVRSISNPAGRSSEAICPVCHRCFVAVTLILHEQGGYGTGATAVASKIRSGTLVVKERDE